ncbi:uncharacterized protein LKV04_011420, partial [Tautogolabrus adspersus]
MQEVIPDAGEMRKVLCKMGEDTEQGRTDVSENSQLKWISFQAKKKQREVEQWLEKTMKEKDELEIMKIKIQRQKEEIQLKLEDTITTILTVNEIKACIEKTAAEMKNTQMELLKDQSKMKENKEEVEKLMVKMTSIKAQISKWILTDSSIRKPSTINPFTLQEPQTETHGDSLRDLTLNIVEERAEDATSKEATVFQQSLTSVDLHQSEKEKKWGHLHTERKHGQEHNLITEDTKGKQSVFLHIHTEIHGETLMDGQTTLVINVQEKAEVDKEMSKLKEREDKVRKQITCAMEDIKEENQEIKRLIMEINDLQNQRPETPTSIQIKALETRNKVEGDTGLLIETENKDIMKVKNTQEESDEIALKTQDAEKQKQSQQSSEDLQTYTEEKVVPSCKQKTGNDDIQRLRREIDQTQELLMTLLHLKLEKQANERKTDKEQVDGESG